jgi:hypothetical protein
VPGSVGGRQDEHAFIGSFHAVHLRQELVDELASGVVAHVTAAGAEGIDFIEKQNARGVIARLLEQLVKVALTVANPHVEDVIDPDGNKTGLDFSSGRPR